jgi:hypothetical protein
MSMLSVDAVIVAILGLNNGCSLEHHLQQTENKIMVKNKVTDKRARPL